MSNNNKNIIYIGCAVVILLIIIGLFMIWKPSKAVKEYVFTEVDLFNPRYSDIIADETTIEYTKENISDSNTIGGGTIWKYTVRGLKPGSTTITIDGINDCSNSSLCVTKRVYYFTVDKNLNIKLKKIEEEKEK